jgi:hypothetical protein
MVVADAAEITRAVNLAMSVSSAIATGHSGIVNSVSVTEGLLRRSVRVSGRRWA